MNEKEKNFIIDWNKNAHLISDDFFGKTYLQLFYDCFRIHKEVAIGDFLIKLNAYDDYDKKFIERYEDLMMALEYVYHQENFKSTKKERKFKYKGETGEAYDVRIDRNLKISNNKIKLASVNQSLIDNRIVEEFSDGRNEYDGGNYRFIFYQCKINNFSQVRLKSWSNIYSKKTGNKNNFLSELVVFFEKYQSFKLDLEKLELLIKTYFKYNGFSYFEDYADIDFSKYIDEAIDVFKTLHFNRIQIDYKKKEKVSIDAHVYRKNEVKRINRLLKTKPNYPSYRFREKKPNIYDAYIYLVNGNRSHFDNLIKKDRAGEVEAMVKFLDYLKGQDIIKNKQVAVKTFTEREVKDLLPIEIFDNTRNYLKKNALQVNTCYKYKAYDACSVLLRKITEILIIEIYEKEEIEYKIKDSDGNYLMLKGLINSFVSEKKFSKVLSRNISEILPKIKRNGDLSAHNRKYNSRKLDIDKLGDDFRLLFEEMINSIYH